MKIGVIASNYPWRSRPYSGAFVRELVWELARQGHDCHVVAPISVWDLWRYGPAEKRVSNESVARAAASVEVIRPRIVTASARSVGRWNSDELSVRSFSLAARGALRKIGPELDAIYAHFFYPAGFAAARCSRQYGVPYFVAHGDDCLAPWHVTSGGAHFGGVSGVVAVSTDNARFCTAEFDIPESKIGLFPNGVDHTLFFPRDRSEARRRLGLPADVPLVAFVGHFIPRKGPDRLLSALEGIPLVGALLIGEGPVPVNSARVVFKGVVDHIEVPWYLSAADLFALPTTGEGSCNAILEAMACGLPVVTSVGSFNDDIVNSDVAVRVDPLSVPQLRDAIATILGDGELREAMGRNGLGWSERFRIQDRAARIAAWMKGMLAVNEATEIA